MIGIDSLDCIDGGEDILVEFIFGGRNIIICFGGREYFGQVGDILIGVICDEFIGKIVETLVEMREVDSSKITLWEI